MGPWGGRRRLLESEPVSWLPLASRLAFHIALGFFLFLLVLGPAPVGRFFFRLTGWSAAGLAVLAVFLAVAGGWPGGTAERLRVLAVLGTALPAPWYASSSPARRRGGLVAAAGCGVVALAANAFGPGGLGPLQLLGDLAGSGVAGGVCFAMIFGHGYLTVPNLPFAHFVRINRATVVALAARLSLATMALTLWWPPLLDGSEALPLSWWLDLSVRFGVGLLVPLLFAWMVHSALRWRNNQSATGILYASTVLVWIGEAVALQIGGAWRVAL